MRYLVLIFLAAVAVASCVKPKTKDPVPVLTFKYVQGVSLAAEWPTNTTVPLAYYKTKSATPSDTANIVFGYQDGDGDIFKDSNAEGSNFALKVYKYDATQDKMIIDGNPIPMTIRQPASGYYKGKSIEGDITIPLSQFRSASSVKILRFEMVMEDSKKNVSNTITSPVYTLTP